MPTHNPPPLRCHYAMCSDVFIKPARVVVIHSRGPNLYKEHIFLCLIEHSVSCLKDNIVVSVFIMKFVDL